MPPDLAPGEWRRMTEAGRATMTGRTEQMTRRSNPVNDSGNRRSPRQREKRLGAWRSTASRDNHRGNVSTPRDRLSKFLEHLDATFETEPEFFPFESKIPGAPNLACMVYRDIPEADHVTGVTYGLSEVTHPRWKSSRPELILSVQSTDTAWPLAVAETANRLRGTCPFGYGDIIGFGGKIAEESELSGFLVFTPSILAPDMALGIDVGGELPIDIAGVHPIYDGERAVLAELGLDGFWKHPHFDRYDVHRPAVTGASPSEHGGGARAKP